MDQTGNLFELRGEGEEEGCCCIYNFLNRPSVFDCVFGSNTDYSLSGTANHSLLQRSEA